MDEQPDLIGVALSGIGAGATSGAAVITTSLIALKALQVVGGSVVPRDQAFLWLTVALFAGLIVAAMVTVALTHPIRETWRRGVTGAIAAFLATMLGAAAALVDAAVGTVGMVVYLGALAIGARRARAGVRKAAGS